MDVVGSEIGQKMRSAIKAKLTELGCYVDDELPDYVMVMVANKRTRAQMEDDLQLFLGDNTELFVNWLHQVLKKLQEVTVAAPKPPEPEKSKEKDGSHSKERKTKEKKSKDKPKKSDLKKAKKKEKEKEKSLRKKEQKKAHKKKKSKNQEMIRPNIPPLLMNMEKDSEPSITDVFAGQILKNHGILLESITEDPKETKPIVQATDAKEKRPMVPIIDPATILSEPKETETVPEERRSSVSSSTAPRDEQLKEMNEIEAKIQGLRQKLAEQLDSMSEDEDFLNIRTEAEELMNDFADDVFQEITEQTPTVATPPPPEAKSLSPPPKSPVRPIEPSKDPIETLPQIELKLPKRPIRERLGAREEPKKSEVKHKENRKVSKSPESFTPERELKPPRPSNKSAKSRIGSSDHKKKLSSDAASDKSERETSSKRLNSRVSVLENRSGRQSCASVVRVRPRPRVPAPANSLLLRAVADAHKSLLNIPPKVSKDSQSVKRALVLPMRRVDSQTIYISVPGDVRSGDNRSGDNRSGDKRSGDNRSGDNRSGNRRSGDNRSGDNRSGDNRSGDNRSGDNRPADDCDAHDAISLGEPESDDEKSSKDAEKEEYIPSPVSKKMQEYGPAAPIKKTHDYGPLTMKIHNSDYVPSRRLEGRTASRKDDSIVIEAINIHNPTVGKDKNTQFIVTMDGFNPNAFLTKKLLTEGILDEVEDTKAKKPEKQTDSSNKSLAHVEKEPPKANTELTKEVADQNRRLSNSSEKGMMKDLSEKSKMSDKSKVSATCDVSDKSDPIETVVVKNEENGEKRKSTEVSSTQEESPPAKKRRSSPIVFDVGKKVKEEADKEKIRERTESVGSDNHVTVTTTTSSHKYDALPPLITTTEKKPVWCRAFPQCRYGATCAFLHPRCKFAAACTRRNCPYSHILSATSPLSPAPVIASHVVPAANYKTISATLPAMCKYYPSCANPACHFYHPKPCRYGKMCGNKLECNFYHADVPSKFRYTV